VSRAHQRLRLQQHQKRRRQPTLDTFTVTLTISTLAAIETTIEFKAYGHSCGTRKTGM
jgi:hypothetical protein